MNTSTPWYLAPLSSRGKFSPRLLMAWQCFYFMCWVIYRWILIKPAVVAGVLIQPQNIVEVVGILAGLVGLLLGLGTIQKTVLGDATPAAGLAQEGQPQPNKPEGENPDSE